MAALKPVQPSVCDDSRVWKKICKTVMSKPDPIIQECIETVLIYTQANKRKKLQKLFLLPMKFFCRDVMKTL